MNQCCGGGTEGGRRVEGESSNKTVGKPSSWCTNTTWPWREMFGFVHLITFTDGAFSVPPVSRMPGIFALNRLRFCCRCNHPQLLNVFCNKSYANAISQHKTVMIDEAASVCFTQSFRLDLQLSDSQTNSLKRKKWLIENTCLVYSGWVMFVFPQFPNQ